MSTEADAAARSLYAAIIAGWNAADAGAFAAPFASDGAVVGFDGSELGGRDHITETLSAIFADHRVGSYVGIVRDVREIGSDALVLRAVSGVVPAGEDDVNPDLNAVQSLVAERRDDGWQVVLYQNTPAQFHGRPDDAAALTEELRAVRRARQDAR